MQIDRKKLIETLKAVKPGLASKEIIEQSTSFIFRNKRVSTYNDEIMITHPVDLDLEGAIQGAQFYELLNKCKDEEVSLQVKDTQLSIKGKKFKAGIRLDAEINLPIDEIPMPKKSNWIDLPEGFAKAIKYCLFSASTDMSTPALTCIHILPPLIESTDGLRLTQYKLEGRADKDTPSILLPVRAAVELINYPIEQYSTTAGWVHFKCATGAIFSCRTMEGKFPSLKRVVVMSGETVTFPKDMIEILERAEVLSETEITKERSITVELGDNAVTVKSESKAGWYEEEFRARYAGPEVAFNINAPFLKEILQYLRKAEIDEGGTKIKFTGDSFVHVIALMRGE